MNESTLRMSSIGNVLIMINVYIWSKSGGVYRKLDLTLDTGASVTTISKELLQRLGYTFVSKDRVPITTASGIEYVDKVILDKIKIGHFTLNNLEAYAHTFPEESFSLGVLGLNALSQFDLELSFSKRLVVFREI